MPASVFENIPKKAAVLIIGAPRSEKTILAEQFLVEGFKNGEKGLFILTNKFPEDVMDEMAKIEKIGSFPIEKKLVKFIDCYTNFVGVPKKESDLIARVSGPSALNEISLQLTKMLNKFSPTRIVFDSASNIILQNNPQITEKFFQVLLGKLRSHSVRTLITLEDGLHDPKDIISLETLTTATIRFRIEHNKKYLEVSGTLGYKIPYKFDGEKLVFY